MIQQDLFKSRLDADGVIFLVLDAFLSMNLSKTGCYSMDIIDLKREKKEIYPFCRISYCSTKGTAGEAG